MSLKPHTDSPRRKDRTISKPEAEDIIERGQYAVLALHSVDKYPYCVPINYAKIGKILYFHCAEEGKKLDCIKSNQYAMVCVVENSQIAAAEFSTNYSSAMAFGKIKVCESEGERMLALRALVDKFSPQYISEGEKMISAAAKRTKILRLDIDSVSGKARRPTKNSK